MRMMRMMMMRMVAIVVEVMVMLMMLMVYDEIGEGGGDDDSPAEQGWRQSRTCWASCEQGRRG
jgi:hypothetical protein